jgi:tRNA (guanine-N7-)-methyltransferase
MPTHGWVLSDLFPAGHDVVLEIGSGMGEATLACAAADPGTEIIALEVMDRGVAALTRGVAQTGLANVRICPNDAIRVLRDWVPEGSLTGIRVWFPDPWPKARHRKRRIIQPAAVALMVSRLQVGGTLHTATDVDEYAEQMAAVLGAESGLSPLMVGGPRPTWRPYTKFECLGLDAGREAQDFIFTRVR